MGGSGFIFACASAREMMGACGVKERGVPRWVTGCLYTEPGIGEDMICAGNVGEGVLGIRLY